MKRFFVVFLALSMAVGMVFLSGCSSASQGGAAATAQKPITIKLPHIYGDGHPTTVAIETFFKKEIEARSNGALIVEPYPNSTLATEEQIYEGLRNGTYEMGMMGIIIQDTLPTVAAFQLPFLFESFDDAKVALLDNGYGLQLLEGIEDQGIKAYTINPDGFRIMTLNRKVESMADFRGFKLRTANYENMIKMGELLGCSVTPMAMTEVFSALEQKVVDGQENPPATIRAAGWYEVQPYMMVSNHVFSPNFTCINLNFYNSLSDELKAVIDEVCYEMTDVIWALAIESAKTDIEYMESNADLEVYYPSDEFRQGMIESIAPLYETLYQNSPRAKEIVEAIIALR